MPAREDLLAIADACAAKALEVATCEGNGPPALGYAVKWTENAKTALEAAGMAATTRDDFELAVEQAVPNLERIGALDAETARQLTPQQFVSGLVRTIEALHREGEVQRVRAAAYVELRSLTDSLIDTFERADNPVAARQAERIRARHDEIDRALAG